MKRQLLLLLFIATIHCSINASAITIEPLADNPKILCSLFSLLYEHMIYKYDPNRDKVEKRYKPFLKKHLQTHDLPLGFVALKDDAPIALCCLRAKPVTTDDKCSWFKDHPNIFPWLAGLFVAPEHRRKGLAKKLTAKVLEQAQKLGYKKLYLFTEKNSTANQIYLKNGCKEFDTAFIDTSNHKEHIITKTEVAFLKLDI